MKTSLSRLPLSARVLFLTILLIVVEGCGVIIALLAEPSQSSGFLGFSAGRWGMLCAHLLALAGLLVILSRIWQGHTIQMEAWLSDRRHLAWSLILALACLGVALPAVLGSIQPLRDFPYFGRLQPTLAWLALTSGQIGLTLLVVLRRSILRWFRQFFPDSPLIPATARLTNTQRHITAGMAILYMILQAASHLQAGEARRFRFRPGQRCRFGPWPVCGAIGLRCGSIYRRGALVTRQHRLHLPGHDLPLE